MTRRAHGWTLAAVVGLLAVPSVAGAATYCVSFAGCVGTSEPDLQTALNAASATPTLADTVQVGDPGAAPAGGYVYSDGTIATNQVDIVGAGTAQTVLTATGVGGSVVSLNAPGSTVSHLTVRLPSGSWNGVQTNGTVRDVNVSTLDSGAGNQVGGLFVATPGSTPGWIGGSIALASGAGSQAGIETSGTGVTLVVQDVAIATEDAGLLVGDGATLTLRRASLRSSFGVQGTGAHLILDNVVLRQTATGPGALGFIASTSVANDGVLDANHVSAEGNGLPASYGILVSASNAGRSATATVRNSIFRDFDTNAYRTATGASTVANLSFSYTDIDLVHVASSNSGGGTGAITPGAGVIDENPHWIDAPGGNFAVPATSPVVDAGQPGPVGAGESTTDLAGSPRIAGGRTDMGAIEFRPPATNPPPPPPPVATRDTTPPTVAIAGLKSKLTLKQFLKGVSFSLTASEPASLDVTLAGAATKATIARAFNLTLAHKAMPLATGARKVTLKPGRKLLGTARKFKVRVTIVATDAAGNRTSLTKTIAIKR
jgi:hypothetical protein